MNLVWIWFPYKFWPDGFNFFGVTREREMETKFSTFLVIPAVDNKGNKQPGKEEFIL